MTRNEKMLDRVNGYMLRYEDAVILALLVCVFFVTVVLGVKVY